MRADYLTRFKLSSDGELAEKPIAVRLQRDVDAAVRAMPSSERSEWLRKAIAAQLEREQQDMSA